MAKLQIQDLKEGDGLEAALGSRVKVHYTGWLEDGTKLESSIERGKSFTFELGAGHVIEGLDEGIAGMRRGGRRRLVVPPELGYGKRGAGNRIPPRATLIFEVELLDLEAEQGEGSDG